SGLSAARLACRRTAADISVARRSRPSPCHATPPVGRRKACKTTVLSTPSQPARDGPRLRRWRSPRTAATEQGSCAVQVGGASGRALLLGGRRRLRRSSRRPPGRTLPLYLPARRTGPARFRLGEDFMAGLGRARRRR